MGDIWAELVSQRLTDYIGVNTGDNHNEDMLVTSFSKRASSSPYYNVRICTDRIGPYYRIRGVTPDAFASVITKPLPDLFLIWSPNSEFAFLHRRAFDAGDPFNLKDALMKLSLIVPTRCIDIDPCDNNTYAFCCQVRNRAPSNEADSGKKKRLGTNAYNKGSSKTVQSVFYYTILISTLGIVSLLLFLVVLRMKSFPRWKLIHTL